MASFAEEIINRATGLGITVPNSEEVRQYLLSYSGVRDVVNYVFGYCRADIDKLKKRDSLLLRVYQDDESGDEYLLLSIRPTANDEEAVEEVFSCGGRNT
ncbi:MAG: hypothetical protein M0Z41_08985 [Peptococcaceae bacterium]|nr:hypothetical protein [Peptococcaceae bacterium]